MRRVYVQASVAVAKTFGKNNNRKQRYYVCSGKFNKAQSAPEEKCPSRYAPAEQLEEIVWKDLFLESFCATRSNCSWLTTAGTCATKVHSSGGSGTAESWGWPMGWVAERRIFGGR